MEPENQLRSMLVDTLTERRGNAIRKLEALSKLNTQATSLEDKIRLVSKMLAQETVIQALTDIIRDFRNV